MDSLRRAASASGWRLVRLRCSRLQRSMFVSYDKAEPGFAASLDLSLDTADPSREGRELSMHLAAQPKGAPPTSPQLDPEGTPRANPECLRGLDASDPAFQRPTSVLGQAGATCSLLPIARVGTVLPALSEMEASEPFNCIYRDRDPATDLGFRVEPALEPRAHYEKDQYAPSDDPRFFLVEVDERRPGGAWVQTPLGPVQLLVLRPGEEPLISENQVLRLARLLADGARR
jgi:hypothetical protein